MNTRIRNMIIGVTGDPSSLGLGRATFRQARQVVRASPACSPRSIGAGGVGGASGTSQERSEHSMKRRFLGHGLPTLALAVTVLAFGLNPTAFADPNDGLAAYWCFNDCTPNDCSGHGLNGTNSGAACVTGPPTCGSAFEFTGSGRVSIPQAFDDSVTTGLTVTAWLYWNGSTLDSYVVDARQSNTGGFILYVTPTGTITFFLRKPDTSIQVVTSLTSVPTHQWTFVAALFDDSVDQVRLVINGIEDNTAAATSPYYPTGSGAAIGNNVFGSPYRPFNGDIDEVRIYNRVLSAAEIVQLYQMCVDQPPVAEAGGPYSGAAGGGILFDASGSYDPGGTIVGYRWDWTNDGTWDTGWLTTAATTHIYPTEFHGQVALEVNDNSDLTDVDTALVDITRPSGSVVAWGLNEDGQCDVPAPNGEFVAVAGGGNHSVGLKADGSIMAWGRDDYGQCDVSSPNSDFIAMAAGQAHSLGLKADSSLVAWGWNASGQCNVPTPNGGFVAVAGGYAHSLGLKSDGSIVAWGRNTEGQCNVPAPNSDFVAVARGFYHSLGLKVDGSIVAWGRNDSGQCNVPTPNSGFVAVAGGFAHSLGLKVDGSIVAWGRNAEGQCNIPLPNSSFVAAAGGSYHSLGLKADGSIVAWGRDDYGQCDVPVPNVGFAAVAGGGYHSLGLKANQPPVADAGGPYTGEVGVPIVFDASGSYDPDGTIVGYRWDWTNDGTWDTTWLPDPTASHVYDAVFHGQVGLEVKDNDDATAADTAQVDVGNEPPVAEAGGPYSGVVGTPIAFSASGSHDSDGTIVGYRWDWTNDGNWDTDWLTQPATTCVYDAVFHGQVRLEVKDDDNATADDTAQVDVTSAPPVAEAGGPYAGVVGESIFFDASGSYDPDGTIVGYRWDWTNDGTWDTGWLTDPVTPHPYGAVFHGLVRLEVKDDAGVTGSDTAAVDISPNQAPVADAGGPYRGFIGAPITFDASGSYDLDGAVVAYRWDWTNDGTWDTDWLSQATVLYAYPAGFHGQVKVEVKDDFDATGADTAEVDVYDAGALGCTYQYDRLHRLVRVSYNNGGVITYSYDAVGNRTLRVINGNPSTVCLHVAIDPPGTATVIRDPDLTWYPPGTPVTLTAEVEQCTFQGWTGDVPPGQEQSNPLTLVMDDSWSVTLHVATPVGDVNCDCLVDFADINPFVLALSDPATYGVAYPDCDILNGDCNGDGVVDFDDINAFVWILSGGG